MSAHIKRLKHVTSLDFVKIVHRPIEIYPTGIFKKIYFFLKLTPRNLIFCSTISYFDESQESSYLGK